MLEVFVSLVSSILLSVTGFYVIKKITRSGEKLLSIKNILLILILSIITVTLHKVKYTGVETFIIFIINIFIYKSIFKIPIEESILAIGIMMVGIIVCDLLTALFLNCFYSFETIRKSEILTLIANISVCLINALIINIKWIYKTLNQFYKYCKKHKSIMNIIFFTIMIIGLCILCYSFTTNNILSTGYIINFVLVISLGTMAYIFVENRNNYLELTDKYDSMFSYVQHFEDLIEKESLNEHEYKNQLAVLRCLTKEKKVKEKIDEILEDSINIEEGIIGQLKQLPKGGIKGLMYYKVALGQKQKIKITVDVSLETKSSLNKLSEKDMRVLCKLIGIYLDNAIEAASETYRKKLLIEIYELPTKVCFVFSNTFKDGINFNERNKKGITTKGEGHGNGLYFASKLIEENDWLESKQDIVDNYYIQQLIIHKNQK